MQAIRKLALCGLVALSGGCLKLDALNVTRTGAQQVDRFEAPDGYVRQMSPAPHNFNRGNRAAGDPVRRGMLSERFELRDGDCGGSDCGNPRARAEIQLLKEINPSVIGQDIWYGWSFYNATVPAFEKENSLRLVFGQWTMGGTHKPIFRFIQLGAGEKEFTECDPRICNTRDRSKGDLVVQLEDIAHARGWRDRQNDGYVCRLFDLAEAQGRWMDLMVNTNFSAGDDGYLRIWVNQKLVCNYAGPLISPDSLSAGIPPQHRRGIYSSWTSRWENVYGDRPKPRLIVYYDEFRVGKGMGEVDIRQLEAANVPPVD